MAWVRQVALEVDGRVTEELLTFTCSTLKGFFNLILGQGYAESLAATAAGCLDCNWIADLVLGDLPCVVDRLNGFCCPWNDWHSSAGHQLARLCL